MKILIVSLVIISLITCSFNRKGVSNININDNTNKIEDSIIVGKNIKSFFGDSIIQILTTSNSVKFNKVIVVEEKDTISGEKSTFNKLESIGDLNQYNQNILKFLLLSDSTYVWHKLKIKHSFDPELTFVFEKDSSKVNIIYSPNSSEIGYRYKDFFNTIYIKNNPLIDDYFKNLKLLKSKKEIIEKDSIKIPNVTTSQKIIIEKTVKDYCSSLEQLSRNSNAIVILKHKIIQNFANNTWNDIDNKNKEVTFDRYFKEIMNNKVKIKISKVPTQKDFLYYNSEQKNNDTIIKVPFVLVPLEKLVNGKRKKGYLAIRVSTTLVTNFKKQLPKQYNVYNNDGDIINKKDI